MAENFEKKKYKYDLKKKMEKYVESIKKEAAFEMKNKEE